MRKIFLTGKFMRKSFKKMFNPRIFKKITRKSFKHIFNQRIQERELFTVYMTFLSIYYKNENEDNNQHFLCTPLTNLHIKSYKLPSKIICMFYSNYATYRHYESKNNKKDC